MISDAPLGWFNDLGHSRNQLSRVFFENRWPWILRVQTPCGASLDRIFLVASWPLAILESIDFLGFNFSTDLLLVVRRHNTLFKYQRETSELSVS